MNKGYDKNGVTVTQDVCNKVYVYVYVSDKVF